MNINNNRAVPIDITVENNKNKFNDQNHHFIVITEVTNN